MKVISIIGIKGIPAKYGGFETLADHLTKNLSVKYLFRVYCSKKLLEKNKRSKYNHSDLVYLPIEANGIQSIFYDIISILHSLKKSDTLLVLGVSGGIVFPFIKYLSKCKLIVNIDGVEHKREKWNHLAKWYLRLAEKLAIQNADTIVTDNKAISEYVNDKYNSPSKLITYGGDHVRIEKMEKATKAKHLIPDKYAFKVCRIEPENNIDLILDAFSNFDEYPLVVVGNWKSSEYGKRIFKKYNTNINIILLDTIYDQKVLNQLRSNCEVYIHGHSAGGTNPSLVEAMYLKLPIIAYDVIFNRYTTENNALFFSNKNDLLNNLSILSNEKKKVISENLYKIAIKNYKWELISSQYAELFN